MRHRQLLREFNKFQAGLDGVLAQLSQVIQSVGKYDKFGSVSPAQYNKNYRQAILQFCEENFTDYQEGSSRIVCEYDDDTVIKIASHPTRGTYQNKQEFDFISQYNNNPLFPHVYHHDDNFNWIVADRVLVADSSDFEAVVGVKFASGDRLYPQYKQYHQEDPTDGLMSVTKFLNWCNAKRSGRTGNQETESVGNWLVRRSEFFKNLYTFITETDVMVGDLLDTDNWGMTERNGKPAMVILDCGVTNEGFDKYY